MTQRQASFITEVKSGENDASSKYKKSNLDITVRKDFAKLQEVVEHFAKKVDQLVDKQRSEYVQAYEFHMSDVQRELHNLREKATAIANDTTREEKIKKLDSDQKWFRNEAMRLDVDTNEYRKKMRSIKVLIQSTERERDWLLEKLRSAKAKFRVFKEVRGELMERYGGELSLGDSDSSYTLELQHSRAPAADDGMPWRNQLHKDYMVTRTSKYASTNKPPRNVAAAAPNHLKGNRRNAENERRDLLSQVVVMRARHDALRDLLGQCVNCTTTGSWSKQRRRPLAEVLDQCRELVETSSPDTDEKRQVLARALALHPEVYYALSDLVQDSTLPVPFDQASPASDIQYTPSHGDLGVIQTEDDDVSVENGSLRMADDVAAYFRTQQDMRRELELEQRGRAVFGK